MISNNLKAPTFQGRITTPNTEPVATNPQQDKRIISELSTNVLHTDPTTDGSSGFIKNVINRVLSPELSGPKDSKQGPIQALLDHLKGLDITGGKLTVEGTNATVADKDGDQNDFNIDQVEAVADVHKNFTAEMMNAAIAPAEERDAMVGKAVNKDLKYMHTILSEKQYRKYLMLLNATLKNRGLIK